ncbi:MAG: low affinity iron permease family protein [Phycisphaerae bacterium]|nr:low affinity iron permease family protein [Saprospiraceae bacterium]
MLDQLTNFFEKFARTIALYTGKPLIFFIAFVIILIWAVTGPIFGFSDTWQLVINTGTTIITFLMIFLVQSAQNRDSKALQLKLDELILKLRQTDNIMVDIENLTERELDEISKKYKRIRDEHQKKNKNHPKIQTSLQTINEDFKKKKEAKPKKNKKAASS